MAHVEGSGVRRSELASDTINDAWNRDYTAFMRCDAGDGWMPQVEAQVGAWLREKDLDFSSADADFEDETRKLSVHRSEDGGSHDLLVELSEETELGIWRTELIAHDEPGGADWIHLAVTNSEGRFVAVPRLAKYLMQVLPLGDGSIQFLDHPMVFHQTDVDQLVALLADGQRNGLVFVAGTSVVDDLPIERFVDKVGQWSKEVYGLAQIVVLDPAATVDFEEKVGAKLAAPAWTIRTYQPGLELSDQTDSRRHRILGTRRLADQPDRRTRSLLGDIARKQAADRELPASVRRVRRRFQRLENRRLVDAVEAVRPEPSPTVPPAPATDVAASGKAQEASAVEESASAEVSGVTAMVKRIFKLPRVTESALLQIASRLATVAGHGDALAKLHSRVEELQSRVEGLEDERKALTEVLEDEQTAHEVALLDVDNRDARIRWLESKLSKLGDHESSYLDTPNEFATERPGSFEELLQRIEELEGIEFTGDPNEVARLSVMDTNDAALRTAWEAVEVVADYARSRRSGDFDSGLDHYLKSAPDGYRTFPPGKWAQSETGTTMNAYGAERIFPVPKSVDPTARVEMKAHFRLARIGRSSPRMYVYDCHPAHALVCIGYIGTHLTNTQTN